MAAVLMSLAVALCGPMPRWSVAVRLGLARPSLRGPVVAGWLVAGVGVAGLSGPQVVLALGGLGAAVVAFGQWRSAAARRACALARAETVEVVDALASGLRAGLLPETLLADLARDHAILAGAARVAGSGGVPDALRAAAREPGRSALADVAGAWQVASHTGASMSAVLDRVADATGDASVAAQEMQAALAPARSTGVVLAALPLVGFALGSGMGADPVAVATSSMVGAGCVAAGVLLAAVGVRWVTLIAERAEAAL